MKTLTLAFILLLMPTAWALDVPKHSNSVIDLSGTLSTQQTQKIARDLNLFKNHFGPQLQVLIIPALEDETIESYSIKVVDEWKLGSAEKDDGVLLLVAINDRKIRIEVGQGVEGDLPDALAGRIIQQGIAPYFKQQQYAAGIESGLSLIAESLGGSLENIPVTKPLKDKSEGNDEIPMFVFFIFIVIIMQGQNFLRRRRRGMAGSVLTGVLLGDALNSHSDRDNHNGVGGFGGGGFGGGGGFSGGGGGGFSGGGASGGW